jgi:general secretion pathway protein H
MKKRHFGFRIADRGCNSKRREERPICNRSAFTLLELLIVMVLIAMISGFSTLYFAGNMTKSKVSATARDMASALRWGRLLATETGQSQRFLVELDARTFGIEGKAFRKVPPDIAVTVRDPLRGDIGHGTYEARLLPTGSVQGGVLTLTKGNTVVTIVPDPVVGVRVEKP